MDSWPIARTSYGSKSPRQTPLASNETDDIVPPVLRAALIQTQGRQASPRLSRLSPPSGCHYESLLSNWECWLDGRRGGEMKGPLQRPRGWPSGSSGNCSLWGLRRKREERRQLGRPQETAERCNWGSCGDWDVVDSICPLLSPKGIIWDDKNSSKREMTHFRCRTVVLSINIFPVLSILHTCFLVLHAPTENHSPPALLLGSSPLLSYSSCHFSLRKEMQLESEKWSWPPKSWWAHPARLQSSRRSLSNGQLQKTVLKFRWI